jgi:surfactin synthase thioesterase subunit
LTDLAIKSSLSAHQPLSSLWIARPRRRPEARFRLFCFPRAGGGVASFRNWADTCHSEIEAVLIQPPGRENRLREQPLFSMESLVSAVADSIIELLDKPYVVYGHSLGAKIALETVRELRRRGSPEPVHFFAGASAGPSVPWPHPPLHHLSDRRLLEEVQQRYGGVPQEVFANPDLWPLLVPALRADLTVLETYRYKEDAPLSCPITCFCGTEDGMTLESDALEWCRQTSGLFQMQGIAGDHFFQLSARPQVLSRIAADLELSSSQGSQGKNA